MIAQKIKVKLSEFIQTFHKAIEDKSFVKMALGNYKGETVELKKLLIKPVQLKGENYIHITYRYKTKDIVKNIVLSEAGDKIEEFIQDGFFISTLFTTQFDLIYENIHNKKIVLRKTAPSFSQPLSTEHDHNKVRSIPPDTMYLHALGISDKHGKVYKATQDKYRQLNHYIHMLEPVLVQFNSGREIHISDMGSGKGYLTFALYDYMRQHLKLNVHMTGVEWRQDLVDICNEVAAKASFDRLHFVKGRIDAYQPDKLTMLIALHACDTATDDAICKGVQGEADVIVVAPCCHKQVRREMEASNANTDVDFLTRYGIFLERQAEMVTDGIRALVLEYFGYKVKVAEFISDAHTPKNVMIIATRTERVSKFDEAKKQKIQAAMEYFSIKEHHLVSALINYKENN